MCCLLFLPFWWIQLLLPRKKNIWVFGAWYGNRYSDNSKHLYLFVKKNKPNITPIWLTNDVVVRNKIRDEEGRSYLIWSFTGIYYTLLASNIIVSSGKADVNAFFTNGANWFQLWHGNPMKKIGLDDKHSKTRSFFHKKIAPVFFPFISEYNYSYVVSNAAIFSDKMASAFNVSQSQIIESGCPRNDVFYDTTKDEFNNQLRKRYLGCKLVYYLPTFRSHKKTKSLFNLSDYNKESFEAFLEKENIVFVSKGHYVDNGLNEEETIHNTRIIHLLDENVSDINFMLKDADLLVTDYSGAYFDFLLTEKPIIFAAFDLKEYENSSRELYFDYEESIAGPIVTNWKGLTENLRRPWKEENYFNLIKEKSLIFNKYHDSDNSKRVYEFIDNV
jgi:CDP-glycerol glycerophosphotransferase (TagB/SpsB family)